MKTIPQIAKECNVSVDKVRYLVQREKIEITVVSAKKSYLDKYQESLIHDVLVSEGVLKELVIESKMNYEQTN